MKIIISEFCGDAHITREHGARVRNEIEKYWNDSVIILDFSGMRIASLSFFDEAIVSLVDKYSSIEEITSHIKIESINSSDRVLLNNLLALRKNK